MLGFQTISDEYVLWINDKKDKIDIGHSHSTKIGTTNLFKKCCIEYIAFALYIQKESLDWTVKSNQFVPWSHLPKILYQHHFYHFIFQCQFFSFVETFLHTSRSHITFWPKQWKESGVSLKPYLLTNCNS